MSAGQWSSPRRVRLSVEFVAACRDDAERVQLVAEVAQSLLAKKRHKTFVHVATEGPAK